MAAVLFLGTLDAAAPFVPSASAAGGGERILFVNMDAGNSTLGSIYDDGSHRTTVAAGVSSACLSADGTKIVWGNGKTVFTMNADGSGGRQVTNPGLLYDSEPCWSPDGRRIVFQRSDRMGPEPDILTVNADGTDVRRIGSGQKPMWSPDGRKIAYETNHRFEGGIWGSDLAVMNADGSAPRTIVVAGRSPAWSPDGSRLVYVDGFAGSTYLRLVGVDGSGKSSVQVPGVSGVWEPTWSPDGRRLAFRAAVPGDDSVIGIIDTDGRNYRQLTSGHMDTRPRFRVTNTAAGPTPPPPPPPPCHPGPASYSGSTGSGRLNQPVVGMAPTPTGSGYWLVASDGGIFSFGDARFYGSTGAIRLTRPIVGMAATPTGRGYWLVASDGGIFSFGDAKFFGSTGGMCINQPVVGIASTSRGRGYWLVASDGGIFSFGDATFHGSTGAVHLNQPIVGMAPTPTKRGYRLVARDGGIFSYGDATFHGSTGAIRLNQPIVGMARTPTSRGYWLVASDGGVFSFGDATFYGSPA